MFVLGALLAQVASAASLLQPQSFPKTSADIGFIDRVVIQQEGYEPWEKEYDRNGNCISGCTYPGLTIQDDLELSRQRTENAWMQTQQYLRQQRLSSQQTPSVVTAEQPKQSGNLSQAISNWVEKQNARRCTPVNSSVPVGQIMPFGTPLVGTPTITSKYGARTHPVTGNLSKHEGVDFSAVIGTDVFTPANGTVAAVWSDSTCGNGLRISHANGYETVYCHLNKVVVNKGDKVEAGCKVAETGNTGRTTGPHLHYGIKAGGDYIDPMNWINTKN